MTREHQCDVCRRIARWGPHWRWYGSLIDLDGGDGRRPPRPIVVMCSEACAVESLRRGLVPADAPEHEPGAKPRRAER